MKHWLLFSVLVTFLLAGCPVSSASQGDTLFIGANTSKVLKGLKGVYVLIEHLRPNAIDAGLSENSLKTYVQLRLREAGIMVLTNAQSSALLDSPVLYINLNTIKDDTFPLYAYNLEISLRETLMRLIDNKYILGATVWNKSITGIVGSLILNEGVHQELRAEMDTFCNDYLKENPKK